MAAFSINAGLQTLREVVDDLDQILQRDFFPCLFQRFFQRFHVRMGFLTRFFFENRFEPSRLRRVVDSRRKSVSETPSERGIVEKRVEKGMEEITLEDLVKIVDNFPKRLKACVDAKGGHFE